MLLIAPTNTLTTINSILKLNIILPTNRLVKQETFVHLSGYQLFAFIYPILNANSESYKRGNTN